MFTLYVELLAKAHHRKKICKGATGKKFSKNLRTAATLRNVTELSGATLLVAKTNEYFVYGT